MTGTYYFDDDDAREDWDAEREAFMRAADAADQLPPEAGVPERFWIDSAGGLPVVRDRLYGDTDVARFLTLAGATSYRDLRETGLGHHAALSANPERPSEEESVA